MLRIACLLLTILASLSAFAQKPAKISGTIKGHTLDSIALGEQRVKISRNGTFSFSPDVTKPQYQKLVLGEQALDLYLEPGKNLVIKFREEDMAGTASFEGKLAIVNQYLLEQARISEQVNAFVEKEWGTLFSKPEAAFIATLDSIRGLYLKPLNALLYKDRTLEPWFLMQQRADLTYPFDRWLLLYPEIHRRYTGEEVSLSPKSEAYLYRINLNDPSQLEFESYKQFARDYLYKIVQQEFMLQVDKPGMDNKWLYSAFKTVPRVVRHPQVREFWLYDYLNDHLENYGSKNLDSLVAAFYMQVRNSEYLTTIQQMYDEERQRREQVISRVYRTVDGYELQAFFNMPDSLAAGEKRPALVHVHGGSGNRGKPDWHFGASPYGFINISIEYRLRDRQGSLPPEQVSDVRTFFRWLHQHAHEFGIDTARIVASGNSNGGFLLLNALMGKGPDSAAATGTNPAADALILQAAGFDATVNNWWDKYLDDPATVKQFSPTEHVRPGLPPMLVIHGTNDNAVPFHTAEAFVEKMKAAGNRVDFLPLKGSPHPFWSIPYFSQQAKEKKESWLRELGYIE